MLSERPVIKKITGLFLYSHMQRAEDFNEAELLCTFIGESVVYLI